MRKRSVALLCAFFGMAACAQIPPYSAAVKLADLEAPFINEASGIADSRVNPGILWVHNDSGDGPYLYAVDHQGKTKAVYRVNMASASDWEDMAYGPGPDGKGNFLYLGDIGDNLRSRTDCTVYRIAEPKIPTNASKTKETSVGTAGGTVRRLFHYPDAPHNAEALLCHPQTGILYIVTKEGSGKSVVFRFPKEPTTLGMPETLTPVATITLPEGHSPLVTGGAISPDGHKVILRTYSDAYELTLPTGEADFEKIWNQPLNPIPMPKMKQGEAICYSVDGKSLYATSEQLPTPLYQLKLQP